MKPRLKFTRHGGLVVLTPGINSWSEHSARTYIRRQYGSIKNFSLRFQLPYEAVCMALKYGHASGMAGKVAKVRGVLGLPSHPTKRSLISAAAHQRKVISVKGELI